MELCYHRVNVLRACLTNPNILLIEVIQGIKEGNLMQLKGFFFSTTSEGKSLWWRIGIPLNTEKCFVL